MPSLVPLTIVPTTAARPQPNFRRAAPPAVFAVQGPDVGKRGDCRQRRGVPSLAVRTEVGLRWRPMTMQDAPAWTALLAASEIVDQTGEHYDLDDLLEELSDPTIQMELDSVAVFDGEPMVAYGLARGTTAPRDGYRVYVEGTVHPQYRRTGLGSEVLRRSTDCATRLHQRRFPDEPGIMLVGNYDSNPGALALCESAGLQAVRWFYDMRRNLAELPAPAPLPEDLRLTGYDAVPDDQLRLAHNEAFADHWGTSPLDEVLWRQWHTGSRAFRPALSLLVTDGDEVAGYLLSYVYEAECAASGVREAWVGQLGTRRPWRGRGVGTALLTAALHRYADADFERAALGVDTGNPTGALGVYQRAGFAPTQRSTTYMRPL